MGKKMGPYCFVLSLHRSLRNFLRPLPPAKRKVLEIRKPLSGERGGEGRRGCCGAGQEPAM